MTEREGLISDACKETPLSHIWYRTFLPVGTCSGGTYTTMEDQEQYQGNATAGGDTEGEQSQTQTEEPSTTNTTTPPKPSDGSGSPFQRVLSVLRSHLLVVLLVLALLLGIALGVCLRLRDEPYSERELMYIRFPGELLMNMLQLLILPLIVSSLVSGMTSLDTRASGRLGLRAVVYYLTTTLMAVMVGIVMVVSIQPGKRGHRQPREGSEFRKVEAADTFLDLLRQMFPDNIIEATFQKTLTTLEEKPVEPSAEAGNGNVNVSGNTTSELVPVLQDVQGINMLGLVVFSIALGIAINHVGPRGLPLKELFSSLSDVTLVLVTVVIWYSPVGVLFLVTEEVVSMQDPGQTFEQLSFYCLTVMVGLAVHAFISLPALYLILCRRNPFPFMGGVMQALITALGTASSSATLPVTMRNLEENNGVDPRVIGFVVPVGTIINMDGTALYEAVAVIFIGQVEGFDMDIGTIIIVSLTSTAAAIGAAGVPQAGLVTMVIVLTAVGFPSDRVGLVLAIDWLLDRFRTAVNVLGDAYGAGVVHHLSKGDLALMDEEDKQAAAASLGTRVDSTTQDLSAGTGATDSEEAISETLRDDTKAHYYDETAGFHNERL